ncbi:hypothetical protein MY3957_001509 [Beauveria namnaoensis]
MATWVSPPPTSPSCGVSGLAMQLASILAIAESATAIRPNGGSKPPGKSQYEPHSDDFLPAVVLFSSPPTTKPGGPVIVIAGGEVTGEYHKPLLTNSVGALLARFHLWPAARPGAPLLRQQLPRAGPGRHMHPVSCECPALALPPPTDWCKTDGGFFISGSGVPAGTRGHPVTRRFALDGRGCRVPSGPLACPPRPTWTLINKLGGCQLFLPARVAVIDSKQDPVARRDAAPGSARTRAARAQRSSRSS